MAIARRKNLLFEFKKKLIIEGILPSLSTSNKSFSESLFVYQRDSLGASKKTLTDFNRRKYADNPSLDSHDSEMENIQNVEDNSFVKNYLFKHLKLINSYNKIQDNELDRSPEDSLKVKQIIERLKDRARKQCLNFLLTNSSTLQNFEIKNTEGDKYPENQNLKLACEISKLRSLIPPIFIPLRSPGQTPDERVIYRFLLEQQRILIKSDQLPSSHPNPTSPSNKISATVLGSSRRGVYNAPKERTEDWRNRLESMTRRDNSPRTLR